MHDLDEQLRDILEKYGNWIELCGHKSEQLSDDEALAQLHTLFDEQEQQIRREITDAQN
jgi:hypothetical protein